MLAIDYLDRLQSNPSFIDQMIKDSVPVHMHSPNFRPFLPNIRAIQFADGSVAAEFGGAWTEFESVIEYENILNQALL